MRRVDPISIDLAALDIAVAIPCLDDEVTISDLIDRVDEVIPTARIYVMDDGSTDETARRAEGAGAEVIAVAPRDNAVAAIFAEIDADVLVMMDGDARHDPRDMPKLIERLIVGRRDMVVGAREDRTASSWTYRTLFGADHKDIFSRYRVFSRRFARSFPAFSSDSEIGLALTHHSTALRLRMEEIEVPHTEPTDEKRSRKPATLSHVFQILGFVRPLYLFGAFAAAALAASALTTISVTPALLCFACGLVLDTIAKGRLEQKRAMSLLVPRLTDCDLTLRTLKDEAEVSEPAALPSNVTRLI